MARIKDWLVAGLVLALARTPRPRARRERIVADKQPSARAERAAILLLLAAAGCAVAFPLLYAFDWGGSLTQTLGASLGLSLVLAGAAFVVLAKGVVPSEEVEEPYSPPEHPEEQEQIVRIVEETGTSISRKRLLKLAGAGAAGALGVALLTPAVSFGPVFDMDPYYGTPWRRGRRLVDERGNPYRADEIEEDMFYTVFPEEAPKEEMASPLIVVRLPERQLDLPAERHDWAPRGIVAYSKICTHAGCAISMYRAPLFEPTDPRPALVCPCHYSTFDPATGGLVTFGPAGRRLPLLVDDAGHLRAGGNFSEPVGPSWWGARMRGPNP